MKGAIPRALIAFSLLVVFAASVSAQYSPPPCQVGEEVFSDVPADQPFCKWIQQLYADDITSGCATGPLRYCPDAPVTRQQIAQLLEKVLKPAKIWGEGRPGATLYGTLDGLCEGPTGIHFGLSGIAVNWGASAAACPAGTWVCSFAERGPGPPLLCNTLRPDTTCDVMHCDESCSNLDSDKHTGWVVDPEPFDSNAGRALDEGGSGIVYSKCTLLPVWCCKP